MLSFGTIADEICRTDLWSRSAGVYMWSSVTKVSSPINRGWMLNFFFPKKVMTRGYLLQEHYFLLLIMIMMTTLGLIQWWRCSFTYSWIDLVQLGHSFCFPLIYLESLYLNLYIYATFALKYQRGRRARNAQWVFEVISTEHIPCRGYFQVVRSRSRAILTQIMQRVLLPGSEVHTDDWASYRNLPKHVANVRVHRTVVHQNHFVDLLTGIHIQEAESAWSRLKYHVEREKGIRRADLQEFLN